MPIASDYTALTNSLKRLASLAQVQDLLGWDEQVCLPPESHPARASQSALVAELYHREASSPAIGDLLSRLEASLSALDADAQLVVRDARRNYDRLVRVPPELAARQAAAHSAAYHAWKTARASSDFSLFAPHLETVLSLAKERAACLGFSGAAAYDFYLDLHDPGLTATFVKPLFSSLKEGLKSVLPQILNSTRKPPAGLFKDFPEDRQERFIRDVLTRLGFDFSKGRLDRTTHPFCSGHPLDTRLTTRYDEQNPLDSLFSSIHECGHGLYQQGLPIEQQGTALGDYVGMAVHESQSRLWENQVGRSRAFWAFWEPRYRELFPHQLAGVSSDQLYLAINAVEITPIRVDADEVTYNLHIMLRFELEQRLFSGDLAIKDLPAAWNALSLDTLGLIPSSDKEGCLQDVHWSGGAFGYFPSYTLGNMMAAQLWATIRRQIPAVESQIAQGDFSALLSWLRLNIHRHGKRYDTNTLVQTVTGEPLSPSALIAYLRERYLPLYSY